MGRWIEVEPIPACWKRGDALRDWAVSRRLTGKVNVWRKQIEVFAGKVTSGPFDRSTSSLLDFVTLALDELDKTGRPR